MENEVIEKNSTATKALLAAEKLDIGNKFDRGERID